jgi:RHS repeat-associated protein
MKEEMLYKSYIYYILTALFPVLSVGVSAQTMSENYVKTETVLSGNGLKSSLSVQYYDGLGRPSVLAAGGVNTENSYVYTMTEYDLQGREVKTWLPSAGSSSPVMIDASQMASYASGSHGGDDYAYSTAEYDAIGRVAFRGTPGQAWHDSNGHQGMRTQYVTNGEGSVKRYRVDFCGNLASDGYYPARSLRGEKVTDEDGHTKETYKNLLGNVVLERRDGSNDTYFVYDKGLLCIVVPPQFQEENNAALLYKYKYDDHGRCTEKRLPGCEPVHYWYDRYGRVSFVQDARLRAASLYRFYLYDGLGRLAVQGECTSTPLMDNAAYEAKVAYGSGSNAVGNTGYSLTSGSSQLPVHTVEIANYYDGYQFLESPLFAGVRDKVGTLPAIPATTLQTAQMLLTSDGGNMHRVMFYDEKGNVTATREYYADGSSLTALTGYSFTNKPEHVTVTMEKNGQTTTVSRQITYDTSSDLKKSVSVSINGKTPTNTDTYYYDALGRISSLMHSGVYLLTRYGYNVNGWVTSTKSTWRGQNGKLLFGEDVYYTDGPGTPCFNGNVSAVKWLSGNYPKGEGVYSGYKYTYDGLDRMTTARSLECTDDQFTETGDNDVEVSYNANGGISTLKRYGRKDDQGIGLVDDLTFTYAKGNQLAYVTDSADPVMSAGAFDFRDNTIETYGLIADRIYDDCGSLLFDTNKGVTMIEYDLLGYPRRVYFSNFGMTEYVYSADGVRLKTRHVTPVPKTKTAPLYSTFTLSPSEIMSVDSTEYYGDFTFEDGAFMRYDFGSGYITPKGTSKLFRYYLKDRLGNIRVVTNRGGTFDQTTHYYPYGATQYSSTGQDLQPYKYNGKELDRMHRLDLYDYGARQYDPVLGQFTQMDPLCEKYYHLSPYMYCAGNPVKYVDPDGRSIWMKMGKVAYRVGKSIARNGLSALNQVDTYYNAVSDIVEAVNTITDENSSATDMVAAGLSIASEVLPISIGDVKSGEKIIKNIHNKITPNNGIASHHGGKIHDEKIDKYVENLKKDDKVTNIRKNQKQVDINGDVVGNNRPDIQYDKNGVHTNVEYDTRKFSSNKHKKTLEKNDPNAKNEFYLIK